MFDLGRAGFSKEARRAVLGEAFSVEFKGYAYRTLTFGRDPSTVVDEGCRRSVRWMLEEEDAGQAEFKLLPEGFEVCALIGSLLQFLHCSLRLRRNCPAF